MVRKKVVTLRFNEEELEAIQNRAKHMRMDHSNLIRNAVNSYVGLTKSLVVELSNDEWEYLHTIADRYDADVNTAVRLLMELEFILANMPLSKVIRPLGELREIFQKHMAEKAKQ